MTDSLIVVSNVLLWVLVLFLFVVVVLIYKQVGELILARGSAPQHDEQGPEVGEVAPPVVGFDPGTGQPITRDPRSELLVFTFPGCAGCEQIAETLPVLAKHRPETRVTVLSVFSARDLEQSGGITAVGDIVLPEALQRPDGREGVGIVIGPVNEETTAHNRYGITATPFALAVDDAGAVVAKGMLRSPEDLPPLIAWQEDETERPERDVETIGGNRAPITGL